MCIRDSARGVGHEVGAAVTNRQAADVVLAGRIGGHDGQRAVGIDAHQAAQAGGVVGAIENAVGRIDRQAADVDVVQIGIIVDEQRGTEGGRVDGVDALRVGGTVERAGAVERAVVVGQAVDCLLYTSRCV